MPTRQNKNPVHDAIVAVRPRVCATKGLYPSLFRNCRWHSRNRNAQPTMLERYTKNSAQCGLDGKSSSVSKRDASSACQCQTRFSAVSAPSPQICLSPRSRIDICIVTNGPTVERNLVCANRKHRTKLSSVHGNCKRRFVFCDQPTGNPAINLDIDELKISMPTKYGQPTTYLGPSTTMRSKQPEYRSRYFS